MRPSTLSEALERVSRHEPIETAMAGFLDTFYGATTVQQRWAAIATEPALTGEPRLDALAAAAAEYLAKLHRLPKVPDWVAGPARFLDQPWFTTASKDPAMLEYLTVSSPAEFRSRNIFTEERPFRRARSALAGAPAQPAGGSAGR